MARKEPLFGTNSGSPRGGAECSDFLFALALQEAEVQSGQLDKDYELALGLSRVLEEEAEEEERKRKHENPFNTKIDLAQSVVDPGLELTDPNPDIWQLFREFDVRFFQSILTKNCVELSWSPNMTLCAGLCGWNPATGFVFIRLSKPLLKLRPRKDLVETLIHEMIHALLFVTKEDDNHESHGQLFHSHMYRINRETGTNITVYHNFGEEVKHYQTHVWRCEGSCKSKAPFYGYVRRAMNRAPGPNDKWHKQHELTCGGRFVKISEPEKKVAPSKRLPKVPSSKNASKESVKSKDIASFFQKVPKVATVSSFDKENSSSGTGNGGADKSSTFVPFNGSGHKLGTTCTGLGVASNSWSKRLKTMSESFGSSSAAASSSHSGQSEQASRNYPSISSNSISINVSVIELD